GRSHGAAAHAKGVQLLGVTARNLGESAEALEDGSADPDTAPVEAGLSQYLRWREAPLGGESDPALRFRLRFAIAAEELAAWTRDLALAVRIMRGKRVPEQIGEAPLGGESDPALRFRLRFAIAAEELAAWTRDLALAVRIMRGKRVPE